MNDQQLAITGELERSLARPTEVDELLALPVGLHTDVREAVYHARVLGMASKSALDFLRHSAAHYRAWVAGEIERKSTKALHLGKAVHAAVLEPERFARQYVIAPDFGDCRRRENKLARDAWRAEHRGSIILDSETGIAELGMVRSLAAHPAVTALVEGAQTEVTARWEDGEIPCKGRADIDNIELELLADVKSTEDARADAFSRSVWNYGYHRQDDWYRRGWRALGRPIAAFVFIVVEKSAPYAVALYELDDAARLRGRQENDSLLARLAYHVEHDEWPGFSESIEPLSLPRWAERAP